jgi:Zn-finger nucleic acid-binding protein
MICPACGNVLQKLMIDDIQVDVCQGGCEGIWFDAYELKKFDEPHESQGES